MKDKFYEEERRRYYEEMGNEAPDYPYAHDIARDIALKRLHDGHRPLMTLEESVRNFDTQDSSIRAIAEENYAMWVCIQTEAAITERVVEELTETICEPKLKQEAEYEEALSDIDTAEKGMERADAEQAMASMKRLGAALPTDRNVRPFTETDIALMFDEADAEAHAEARNQEAGMDQIKAIARETAEKRVPKDIGIRLVKAGFLEKHKEPELELA